jgi:hypothetical protein
MRQVGNGPVISMKNGQPVPALVAGTHEVDLERLVMAHMPRLRQLLDGSPRANQARWWL